MASPPPKRALTLEDIPGAPSWVEGLLGPLNTALRASADGLAQGLTFRENFAGEVRQVEVTCPEDWEGVAFSDAGGFENFGGANQVLEVRKKQDGTVKVRGVFRRTSGVPAAGTIISELSESLLPPGREILVTYNEAPASVGSISVSPAGMKYESGPVLGISVSGVEWTAANRTPPRWAAPVDVRLGTKDKQFPGRPGYVLVLGCRARSNPTAPVVVTGLDWVPINLEKQRNAPGVRLHRVWGLVPGTTYTLTLLVLPE